MFVIRPRKVKTTPGAIARALHTQTRFYPNTRRPKIFDYRKDFFMAPVAPQHVKNALSTYPELWDFATRNKYGQRKQLEAHGVAIPKCAASTSDAQGLADDAGLGFVVRPLRHSAGRGYRVTHDRLDFQPGSEYISELFPKKREYRVIFVFGKPLIWLRKKPNDGVTQEQPWGHQNSFFQTINDVTGSKLATTDCVAKLCTFHPVSTAHIVAADILYNSAVPSKYAVLELNFCPALSIEGNTAKVLEAIRARV